MNYHNITTDDMLNGSGLRVVLWVSGCDNQCVNCQNPQTWDANSGILFDHDAWKELCKQLAHDYISGITFSGGDPMHDRNIAEVYQLCKDIKNIFPNKTIWLYTGYEFEKIWIPDGYWITQDVNPVRTYRNAILKYIDVLVDGKFVQELSDVNYHWAGSTNQRVIDVQKTLRKQEVVLFEE